MPPRTVGETGRPKAFETILLGGLIAGALDGLNAVVFDRLSFGVTPAALFQHIASGLLGARSFRAGSYTTVLGVGLHFSIAIGAAVHHAASLVIPALFQKPGIYGPTFGILVYLFMHYVVLPLSAVTRRTAPVTGFEVLDQLISRTMFVFLSL